MKIRNIHKQIRILIKRSSNNKKLHLYKYKSGKLTNKSKKKNFKCLKIN